MNKPITMHKLFNPTSDDLHFTYDSAPYSVPAGESREFVEHIAVHGAKKLADREKMTNNPDEHRVLTGAYLENSPPEVVAKNLGINLVKIKQEALLKKQSGAKVANLETQVANLTKEMANLISKKEEKVEEKPEEKPAEKDWNALRAEAKEKGVFKVGMTKDDVVEALKE